MGCISPVAAHIPGMCVQTCMLLTVTWGYAKALACVKQPEEWPCWGRSVCAVGLVCTPDRFLWDSDKDGHNANQ